MSAGDITIKIGNNVKTKLSKEFIDSMNNIQNDVIYKSIVSKINFANENSDYIKELKDVYQKENLVFVLGAGIGIDYNLPDWNTLLQRILLNAFNNENDNENVSGYEIATIYSELFTKCFITNPLISARYLSEQNKKNSEIEFQEIVRAALYQNIKKEFKSKLVGEISQFCIAAGKSPNLDSIITYNYDDIIEKALDDSGVDIPYKSIYKVGMSNVDKELPIYHVHGYLPREGKIESGYSIILGEDSYHQQYNDTYSWNNIVQINKFREKNCVFIGISFSDPNLRRLLDIAMIQKGTTNNKHYLFKMRYKKDEIEDRLRKLIEEEHIEHKKKTNNVALSDIANKLITMMEKFEQNDANSFGVNLIWINSYDEIPETLKKIRNIR